MAAILCRPQCVKLPILVLSHPPNPPLTHWSPGHFNGIIDKEISSQFQRLKVEVSVVKFCPQMNVTGHFYL